MICKNLATCYSTVDRNASFVRIYGLKREGGELFKGGFQKLFKLKQNPLNETQSEIQLANI